MVIIAISALLLSSFAPTAISEDIYYHRNLGKAYVEDEKFPEAIKELEECVKLKSNSALDRINLGIAYLNAGKLEESIKELTQAYQLDPKYPHIYYNLGILYKRQGDLEQAALQLQKSIQLDPNDPDARYNLGVVLSRLNKHNEAAEQMKKCVELAPDHVSAHYQLYRNALRLKKIDEAQKEFEIFEKLRKTTPDNQMSVRALERSIYSELIDEHPSKSSQISKPATKPKQNLKFSFSNATSVQAKIGSKVKLIDYNNDGYLDFILTPDFMLYKNNKDGTFSNATPSSGLGNVKSAIDAALIDYDNDGNLDLIISSEASNWLYKNNGNGTFSEATPKSNLGSKPPGKIAVADYDHDGDIDILNILIPETGKKGLAIYRNNGDGTFTETTDESGLRSNLEFKEAVFTDLDNDNDIDLYAVGAANALYTNLRGGKFKEIAALSNVALKSSDFVASGDYNNDGNIDLIVGIVGTDKKSFICKNRGDGNFISKELQTFKFKFAKFFDFDNDGDLDIFGISPENRCFIQQNDGGDGFNFTDVSKETGVSAIVANGNADIGDYDNDGDSDILIATSKGVAVLRNEGGNSNNWIKVALIGTKTNKIGIGNKVEVKAGSFYQKVESNGMPLLFGLGDIKRLDLVRIKWSNGVAQNQMEPLANRSLQVTEKEGVPSSCPFVYVWNGEKYQFITDILDVGALGVLMAPGEYLAPDHDEYVKIPGTALVPIDGYYSIKLSEELEEIVFLDDIKLIVVDHTKDVQIFPNDMFTLPPFPKFHIYGVKNPRPPVSAFDLKGEDVIDLIKEVDRRYPEVEPIEYQYQGLAKTHSITFDLGDLSKADKVVLFLTGWVNWGNSTSNLAASQRSDIKAILPYLEVMDENGNWKVALENMGFFAGWNKSVPVDLTNILRAEGKGRNEKIEKEKGREGEGAKNMIRITTNLQIYWDQILIVTEFEAQNLQITTLKPTWSNLSWKGYSKPFSPDGKSPHSYDYYDVDLTSPWKTLIGNYTRYGDVKELLESVDDKYVIFSHGEEVDLEFDSRWLPSLPLGWSRDFILYADGWIKDGDINTAYSQTVEPLPFHAMSGYPYSPSESYPKDEEHSKYIREYNIRGR